MDQQRAQSLQPDEIDLRELLCRLWDQKVLVVLCTAVVTIAAAAYAFLSTPIYEATVQTLPPTASNLAPYNAGSQLTGIAINSVVNSGSSQSPQGIGVITPREAYETFLRQLSSETVRQVFFEQYYLPAHGNPSDLASVQRAWNKLGDNLTITKPKSANDFVAKVALQGEDPQIVADWANSYVAIAAEKTHQEFVENLKGEVQVRQQGVTDQISTLRKIAQTARRDRITRLQSALAIAESIGLKDPPAGTPLISLGGSNSLDTHPLTNGTMMYLLGAKALRAELEELEGRKNDDAYIPELHSLLKKQALLNGIDLDLTLMKTVTIDRAAITPLDPIKPKKLLILALGVVMGGLLGIFIALLGRIFRPGTS